MEWKDVAGGVAKVAPLLGTALGGPLGGAIGGVVALLASAFGLTPEQTTPEKINQLMVTDPQSAIKLAEIEANHKLELEKLVLEQNRLVVQEKQADLADTADARLREREIVKATGKIDINLYLIAWLIIIGFFILTGILIFKPVPVDQNGVVFMLFGGLVAGFSTVVGYFFGSSRGSLMKSQLIASRNGKV